MSFDSSEVRDRFDQIIKLKENVIIYERLREAIRHDLEHDEQFRTLLRLSEQARQFVTVRDSEIGCSDQLRNTIAGMGETLDEALHRRADEVITEICASYVRQDDRWIVDDPDSVDMTEIQAAVDGKQEAHRWLDDHQEIVDTLNITYPEDKNGLG